MRTMFTDVSDFDSHIVSHLSSSVELEGRRNHSKKYKCDSCNVEVEGQGSFLEHIMATQCSNPLAYIAERYNKTLQIALHKSIESFSAEIELNMSFLRFLNNMKIVMDLHTSRMAMPTDPILPLLSPDSLSDSFLENLELFRCDCDITEPCECAMSTVLYANEKVDEEEKRGDESDATTSELHTASEEEESSKKKVKY